VFGWAVRPRIEMKRSRVGLRTAICRHRGRPGLLSGSCTSEESHAREWQRLQDGPSATHFRTPFSAQMVGDACSRRWTLGHRLFSATRQLRLPSSGLFACEQSFQVRIRINRGSMILHQASSIRCWTIITVLVQASGAAPVAVRDDATCASSDESSPTPASAVHRKTPFPLPTTPHPWFAVS
jgi:hypothetical protein